MAGGVITISRRKYAAGLFWQPISGRAGARENAAKIARMAKIRASLYVQFGGMVGLSGRRGGVRAAMPVAAAEVIEAFGENTFLSAFDVKEGAWLFAVRGGVIIRDQIYKDIAAAKKDYLDLNTMPDWALLVAPGDWNAPSAVERKLADIASNSKKYRLHNISHLPGYILTAAILGAALFFGWGMFEVPIRKLFRPPVERLDIDPELAAEFRRGLAKIDAPAAPPPPRVVEVPFPYENLPSLFETANLCWHAVAFLSQQIVGWSVSSIVCEQGSASAHMLRTHGTIGGLWDTVTHIMPGVVIEETTGSDVILTAALRPLDTSAQLPAFTATQVMTAVQSAFQRINEEVTFRRDFIELEIPELYENDMLDTDLTYIPVVVVEARSRLRPLEFIRIMDGMEGIEFTEIRFDARDRIWTYKMIIYVK